MKALDIATMTESLEKSLHNFSLNNRNDDPSKGRSSSISDYTIESVAQIPERSLELNSQVFLPHHYEQCLDLKTGEIYYINRRNGMRVKENPRRVSSGEEYMNNSSLYSEEDSSCDSEESWFGSSSSSTEKEENDENDNDDEEEDDEEDEGEGDVLVVAGCKTCFMYYMVPKFLEHCPKCSRHLLHFDRPLDVSS